MYDPEYCHLELIYRDGRVILLNMAEKIGDGNGEEEREFAGEDAAANDVRVEEEIEVEGNVSKDEKEVVMEDVGCY